MIIIEANLGLCNRLRAIQSAFELAKQYGHSLKVIWPCTATCNCNYEDLFDRVPDFTVKNVAVSSLGYKIYRKIITAHSIYISQEDMMNKNLFGEKMVSYLGDALTAKNKTIFISTYSKFYNATPIKYEWLKLNSALESAVTPLKNKLNGYSIGVHIRRSDNSNSCKFSPTEEFIRVMKNELELHPECTFYIASDDEDEKKKILELFGERVIQSSCKVLNRNSREGMKGAVIDLFVLASTKLILGSYYSSFSEEAAKIGGCKIRILKV